MILTILILCALYVVYEVTKEKNKKNDDKNNS